MKVNPLGIDHVMVTVGNLEVAKKFYEEILCLEEIDCPIKDGQRVCYKIGNQQLHVNLQEKHHKSGFCHFAIAIDSTEYHVYAKFVAATGYKLSCESRKFADGLFRFFLDDPFANTIEIYESNQNT